MFSVDIFNDAFGAFEYPNLDLFLVDKSAAEFQLHLSKSIGFSKLYFSILIGYGLTFHLYDPFSNFCDGFQGQYHEGKYNDFPYVRLLTH